MVKSIHVEEEVWKKLTIIKAENNFQTLNQAVKYLFKKAGEEDD